MTHYSSDKPLDENSSALLIKMVVKNIFKTLSGETPEEKLQKWHENKQSPPAILTLTSEEFAQRFPKRCLALKIEKRYFIKWLKE